MGHLQCTIGLSLVIVLMCLKSSPSWLPFVGNVVDFRRRLSKLGYHHLVWENLSENYGEVVGLKLGRIRVVAVFGADAVREVLTREEFEGKPNGYFFRLRTFGKRLGLIFSDGLLWQKQRKFSVLHLRNFGLGRKEMEEKIHDEAIDIINVFTKTCEESIEMHSVLEVSVLNVLWTMIAGERFNINDEKLAKLLEILHEVFRLTDMSGGILNQLPFLRYIAPEACGYNRNMRVLNRMWQFLDETIIEHKKTVQTAYARDLIDAFLHKMHEENDPSFTDHQLVSLCLDMFMAGSETTSNTLSFSMTYMMAYPEVQKKVQKELDDVVGRNRWPSLQDRAKLKYTEAVLMEVQRRANVAPLGIAHRTLCDTHLFGHHIPNNTIVFTSLYSIHMDEKYWKDPLAFRPERFLDDDGNVTYNERYFAPFGYGKHRCLGESLAKASYFIFFTTILHNFTLEWDPNEPAPLLEGRDGITLSPNPFKAKLTLRHD